MNKIRSFLFKLTFSFNTLWVGLVFLIPSLFSYKIANFTGRVWGHVNLFSLKLICNITYEVKGKEFIPKQGAFIIAAKHQSIWETMSLLTIFPNAVIIHKKELLYTPVIGLYLKAMRMISINRQNPRSAISSIKKHYLKSKNKDRPLIIFPEGTRTNYGEKTAIKPGIYLIAKETKFPILPVTLNSGKYWPKKGSIKPNGKIIVEAFATITELGNKNDFLNKIEKQI